MTTKICPICKKEFITKNKKQVCCTVKCASNNPKIIQKRKKTILKRYGDENYNNIKKMEQTKLDRYGNKNYTNIKKIKQTIKEKYNVENPFQSETIKEKIKQINLKNLGVEYPGQSEITKRKSKQTKKERYNDENYNNRKKSKQTKKERYNDENYTNKQKSIQTKFKKFYKSLFETNRLQNKVIPLFKLEEYKGFKSQYKFQCKKCNNIFYDNLDNGKVPRCLNCYPYLIEYSELEKKIFNYIKTIYNGTIIENGRKLLSGLEIDIYIPDKKLAIEFDGLYWHSQLNGKNKNYHLNKTKLCEDQGIQLIHIFEDEWLNKQDIVKSRLQHILGQNSNSIFARNCKIREITATEKRHFLDQYHIQGNDKSAIKLGLFNDRELIAVMTFGKRRLALGKKSSEEGEFELLRFATSKSVIGGAGKLLKYFIRNYNSTKIISYADRRWTYKDNNVYEKIGFGKVGETPVNYWYIKETTRIHRFNFRKNVLNEKLKNFDPQLTEWQNMQLNNYNRIWDCGSLKYEMEI